MSNQKKIFIAVGVIIFAFAIYLIGVFMFINQKNKSTEPDISQQTAPPYEGTQIVTFDDQTNGELYRAIGSQEYLEIRYFIGEYLGTQGVSKNPVPTVIVSDFKSDLEFLGESGNYNNIYTFAVNSPSINKSFSIKIVENSSNSETIATVLPGDFSKNIKEYSYENY
jgi:hypothetical protein